MANVTLLPLVSRTAPPVPIVTVFVEMSSVLPEAYRRVAPPPMLRAVPTPRPPATNSVVPALRFVLPVKLLDADSTSVPAWVLLRAPLPLSTPESVSFWPLTTSACIAETIATGAAIVWLPESTCTTFVPTPSPIVRVWVEAAARV